MTDHPITPPPELMQQWVTNAHDIGAPPGTCPNTRKIIVPAINWGWQQRGAVNEAELQKARDEELEACCEWLEKDSYGFTIAASAPHLTSDLRAARRPKPRSGEVAKLVKLLRYEARVSGPHESAHPSWCAAMDRAADLLEQSIPPKPPSLKEQALEALKHVEEGWRPVPDDCALIRRALESLPS